MQVLLSNSAKEEETNNNEDARLKKYYNYEIPRQKSQKLRSLLITKKQSSQASALSVNSQEFIISSEDTMTPPNGKIFSHSKLVETS